MTKVERYFYGRVSTVNQDLKVQEEYADKLDIPKGNRLLEKLSGIKLANRKLQEFIESIPEGATLHVMKLDRLSRSLNDALAIAERCQQRRIVLDIGGFGVFDDRPGSKLMFQLLGAVAEFEHSLIVERTQRGKAYAKEHDPNFKDGRRPKMTTKQIERAYKRHEAGETIQEVADSFNVSKRTLQRHFRKYEMLIYSG